MAAAQKARWAKYHATKRKTETKANQACSHYERIRTPKDCCVPEGTMGEPKGSQESGVGYGLAEGLQRAVRIPFRR
jgi:hypothetical protein